MKDSLQELKKYWVWRPTLNELEIIGCMKDNNLNIETWLCMKAYTLMILYIIAYECQQFKYLSMIVYDSFTSGY